jgi:L-threonylcarbamoyladenylate synthase
METIKLDDSTDRQALIQRIAEIILSGDLVCMPCNGTYRIVADLTNADAVLKLMQSKSRAGSTPALVFLDSEARLDEVAEDLHPLARKLAKSLWPQHLTIRVQLSPELPRAITRHLGARKAKVGVRVPADDLAREVARSVGRPLLISSANRQKKRGESSPAQVRKTFGARIALFVDQGDLQKGPRSTVIDVVDGELSIEREGAIPESTLREVLAA